MRKGEGGGGETKKNKKFKVITFHSLTLWQTLYSRSNLINDLSYTRLALYASSSMYVLYKCDLRVVSGGLASIACMVGECMVELPWALVGEAITWTGLL